MNTAQYVLHEKFLEIKTRNPQFTLRAFARRMGVSSGALSEILAGKRKLTVKSAMKFAEKLCLGPEEVMRMTEEKGVGVSIKKPAHEISQDQFRVISDWWHFAILNLIKTKDFVPDENWISQRLGLTHAQTVDACERLFKLGLMQREKMKSGKMKWMRSTSRLQTSDEILDLSVRKSHLEDLELIRNSIQKDSLTARDSTSITFAINPARLKEAKDFLRQCQDEFIDRFENKNATEVYRLSNQLFPLSRR